MYTSEVLAVVMQQLMEQSPLPMLLMRTVIQSLTMYPRLGGFVMNILARLIMKQVTRPWPSGLCASSPREPSMVPAPLGPCPSSSQESRVQGPLSRMTTGW